MYALYNIFKHLKHQILIHLRGTETSIERKQIVRIYTPTHHTILIVPVIKIKHPHCLISINC